MQLFVLNASPRGAESTGKIMTDHLVAGFLKTSGNSVSAMHVSDLTADLDPLIAAFNACDNVIIAYPLYIDAMPAFTLAFFNELVPRCDKTKPRNIGFVLPYGFPESTHAQAVKRFNEKLTARLRGNYLGTLSRGYCNRLEQMDHERTKPVFDQLHELGKAFGRDGRFNPDDVEKFAGRKQLPKTLQWKINLLYSIPTNSSFLVRELWVHGTFGKRNNAPYFDRS